MGFALTPTLENPRQKKPTSPRKTASGDFFANPNRTRPANRRQPLKTQLGKPTYAYRIASGRPFWPSRDPIGYRGGANLYGFVNNNGVNSFDILGLATTFPFTGGDPSVTGIGEPICPLNKKIFFIARDFTYHPPAPEHRVPGAAYNPPSLYSSMILYAEAAGFEVVEDADAQQVKEAWESKTYVHIVYYNHGSEDGKLSYTYNNGLQGGSATIPEIFKLTDGDTQNLTICCCHFNRVVTEEYKLTYLEAGINLSALEAPQISTGPGAGRVIVALYDAALADFFKELATANEPKCK